jgi:tRNA1(Val) A37 N6-methylase TrmN6
VRPQDFTLDGFLGGRLQIAQPKKGFRAGHDSVLLAAAVAAEAGSRVLELGAGAGVASLCLAARVPDIELLGIEIDTALVALANANAARNGMASRVRFESGDATNPPGAELHDHVFLNPPFYPPTGQPSPNPARARAMRDSENALSQWMRAALAQAKPGGTVTAIMGAERAQEMLSVNTGAVLFPLFPRYGQPAKRVIVHMVKGSGAPFRVAAGLILHEPDGRNTEAAEAVLRGGCALRLI